CLGRGCGTLPVPGLVVVIGLVQWGERGTALLALIPICVIGAVRHHKTHTLGLREAAVLGACGALTVPIGAEIASHVGALPLRVSFAAFLIATVGRGLVHARKPAAAAGSRSATGGSPKPATHVPALLHRRLHP